MAGPLAGQPGSLTSSLNWVAYLLAADNYEHRKFSARFTPKKCLRRAFTQAKCQCRNVKRHWGPCYCLLSDVPSRRALFDTPTGPVAGICSLSQNESREML